MYVWCFAMSNLEHFWDVIGRVPGKADCSLRRIDDGLGTDHGQLVSEIRWSILRVERI